MEVQEACAVILGRSAARSITDDMGEHWCFVAAVAAARTSHPRAALDAIRSHLAKIKKDRSR